MFDNLSERLGGILDRLTGRGALSEAEMKRTSETMQRLEEAARAWGEDFRD